MRVGTFVLVMLAAQLAAAERAQPSAPAPTPSVRGDVRGEVLLAPEASWRWQVVTVPAVEPAPAASPAPPARADAPPPAAGAGQPPPRWPYALAAGPEVTTLPDASEGQRVAAAYGVTRFTLDADDQGLVMLELRMRYRDGVAAWLNGVEVVRRALDRSKGPLEPAERPHGPEWETFYIPVGPHLLHLGTNTLAVELRPSRRRTAPTAQVELIGRRDRGIVRGPLLSDVGATTAELRVETDPGTAAVLEWGTGDALDRRAVSPPGRRHTFPLAGLPANGRVRYRVSAGASVTPIYAFHTLPGAGDVVRIGIYGDVRGGHDVHRRLVEAMLAEPLDAIGVTGDLVLRGTDGGDWQRFFAITEPLLAQVLYLPAIGNHDLGWKKVTGQADAVFPLPPGPPGLPPDAHWYSYDVADVHLVFLDSNAYDRAEQLRWLDDDLAQARARDARAILVVTHDGPYSRGYHRGNVDAQTRYVPILKKHRVDLVFSGHDHIYQRGEIGGIRYIVTGGGGAPLYAATCGGPGKRACAVADGMQAFAREHHFLVLTIDDRTIEMCPRRVDGRLLESCTRYRLRR